MRGWQVHIKRRSRSHTALLHDHDHRGRAGAYRAAKAWFHETLTLLPPPLCISARDVRSNTGEVGVSLARLVRPNGKISSYYRAVWPLGQGRYKKRAFSIDKLGKRAAFKLAARARREGVAQLARSLRENVDREIERAAPQGAAHDPCRCSISPRLCYFPLPHFRARRGSTLTRIVDPTPKLFPYPIKPVGNRASQGRARDLQRANL